MITNDAQLVRPSKAPNLSLPPVEYQHGFFDDLLRTLRLYYVAVDNAIQQLVYGFKVSGAYYSTTTQTVAAANAVTLATYNNTFNEVGVRLDTVTSRIVVERTGIFEVVLNAQVDKTGGGTGTLFVWLRVNGVNAPNTASEITIATASERSNFSRVFMLNLTAEDYVEVAFSSTDTTVRFLTVAAAGNVPVVPSITTAVTFIAPI